MKNKRLEYLDIARGISLFFVILSHSKIGIPFASSVFTSCYIAVFFIISGYLSNINRFNIKKRAKRLIYPYLFYSLFLLLFMTIINVISKRFSFPTFVISVFGIIYSRYALYYPYNMFNNLKLLNICNAPLWFFTAMFSASLIYFIFRKFYKKSNKSKIILVITFLFVTYLLNYLPILLPWSFDTAFVFALFLYVGTYLKDNNVIEKYFNIKFLKKFMIFILSAFIYLILIRYNNGINLSVREFGYHGFASIILTFIIGILGSFLFIVVAKILSKIKLVNSLFISIGKNSVVLFSLHYFVFYLIERIVSIDGVSLLILETTLSITILSIFSLIYSKVFKRNIK